VGHERAGDVLLAPASNRRAISEPMLRYLEKAGGQGGEWMTHNYVKVLSF